MSAFFIVLLGGKGTTSVFPEVVGVSASALVGTVAAGSETPVDLTGVFSTVAVGQVQASSTVVVLVTGLEASGAIGTSLALAESDVLLTGVSSSGGVGLVSLTGTSTTGTLGVSSEGRVGSVAIQTAEGISFTVTGVSSSAAVGNVAVSTINTVNVNLTGVSSTAFSGNAAVTASSLSSISGVSATGLVGNVVARTNVSVLASGVSSSAAVGSVQAIAQQTVLLSGVAGAGQVAGVTANVTAVVSVNVTGVSATGSVGAVAARTSDDFIVLSTSSSPYVHAYEWDDTTGFGAKFANPASLPVGATFKIDLTTYAGTKYVAASSSGGTSGFASYIYPIDGITGWGARQNGDNNQRSGLSVKWFKDAAGDTFLLTGSAQYAGSGSTANVNISKFTGSLVSPRTSYAWFDDGFTELFFSVSDIAYVGIGSLNGAVIGGFGAVAGGPPSTYLQAISTTESTMAFGVTVSPTSKPQGPVNALASYDISRSTNPRGVVFAAFDNSPYVGAWKVESNNFALVRYTNPSSELPGRAEGVAYRPVTSSSGEVAVAHLNSPRVSAYAWTTASGFGVKYSNPVTLPTGSGESVKFNDAGTCVAVGHATNPRISVYPWSTASGFGAKYSNPATAMTANVLSIAFSK